MIALRVKAVAQRLIGIPGSRFVSPSKFGVDNQTTEGRIMGQPRHDDPNSLSVVHDLLSSPKEAQVAGF